MPLPAGSELGPYRIIDKVGAGGMGEVYRARDGRLNRDVAIKVLPASVAADEERLRRFTLEAQTAGGLNHPNILAIYDAGTHDGQPYLVAELLQGETLRARLDAGPVPLSKAIDYVRQTAAGLGAAHASGITHRDIKPENLFLTTDGRVKILDFGLAKALAPASTRSTTDETRLQTATSAGVVLGTVGYMSPEQVRGLAADHRSDLFSLGVVLYELLAGRRPFVGDSAVQTMNAVLVEDPADVALSGRQIPPALAQVVHHCLEKNPEERFQSARDLSFALQAATTSSSSSSNRHAVVAAPSRSARTPMLIAAVVVAAVGIAAFFAGRSQRTPPAAMPGVATFQQLTDRAGVETSPTLSPDGKILVYVSSASGNDDLYSLRVGGRTSVPLTADSPGTDDQPAFSPDGERIAFHSTRDGGGVFVMNVSGESVRRLTDSGFHPSWSPTGREIVVSVATSAYPTDRSGNLGAGLIAFDVTTAQKRIISKTDDALEPSWSPHGTRVAFWGLRGTTGQRDIWTIAADESETDRGATSVTNDPALDWAPTWSPDGRYLYFSSNRGGPMNLWRVPIDEATGKVLGDPEPVTTPSTWSGGITFSRDGSQFAFASVDWRSTLLKVGFDPAREIIVGTPTAILKSTRPIRDHQMSPDGQWVAYTESSPVEDLIVARTDGSQYRRLTDDAFRDRGPSWSPDGQRIAFYSDRSGRYEVWTIRPDGSGVEKLTSLERANFPVWSPDGARMAFSGVGIDRWFIIESRPNGAVQTLGDSSNAETKLFRPSDWSRTGEIAGFTQMGETASPDVMIYSTTSHTYRRIADGVQRVWQWPMWIGTSGHLIVRDQYAISVLYPDTGVRRALLPVGGYPLGRNVGLSRDARWITYTETGTEGDIWLATFGSSK